MNNRESLLRPCKIFSAILTLGVSMNACATSTFTWKEEVLILLPLKLRPPLRQGPDMDRGGGNGIRIRRTD